MKAIDAFTEEEEEEEEDFPPSPTPCLCDSVEIFMYYGTGG
jgi:hypothetical protein